MVQTKGSDGDAVSRTMEMSAVSSVRERRQRARARVPALTLLCHPDWRRVGEGRLLPELAAGGVCRLSRVDLDLATPEGGVARPLSDPYLSRSPLLLAGLGGGAVRLVTEGTPTPVEAWGRAVEGRRDFTAAEVERGVVLNLAQRVVLLLHTRAAQPVRVRDGDGLVGGSDEMVQVRREIRRVADLDVPVLLRGETGTGKELVARAIHRRSRRREREMLCVNMAAVPASLAASELFGAVKGAFTGSVHPQAGFFQRADGGTLFLDEVGDAPAEVQAALLRVLESGEIQRVGSQTAQTVDVRLLAATDLDLESASVEGDFRAPLLHRLAGYEILLPPLRRRRDDFGRLFFHFLHQELDAAGEAHRLTLGDPADQPWMPASIVARLACHRWPGNVRQLQNVARQLALAGRNADHARVTPQVERLLREAEARGAGGRTGEQIREQSRDAGAGRPPLPVAAVAAGEDTAHDYRPPSEVSEDELVAALRAHRWQVKPAAQALGVSRPSLYGLIEKSDRVRKVADLADEEIEAAHRDCAGDLGAMVDRLEVSENGLRQRLARMELTVSWR